MRVTAPEVEQVQVKKSIDEYGPGRQDDFDDEPEAESASLGTDRLQGATVSQPSNPQPPKSSLPVQPAAGPSLNQTPKKSANETATKPVTPVSALGAKNGASQAAEVKAAVLAATSGETSVLTMRPPASSSSIPARTGPKLEKEPMLEKEPKLEEPPAIIAATLEEIRKVDETKNERLSGVVFPESAYLGLGAKFAEFYSQRSEPPKEFFYLEFLTQVGGILSSSIRANFPYSVQPRIYLLKIGSAGWGRKSFTSEVVQDLIQKASLILKPPLFDWDDPKASPNARFQNPLYMVSGAGSGEGLVNVFNSYHRVLFYIDELRRVEQKLAVEGSTLLTVLIELFNKNNYQNFVLKHSIDVRDAHLVLSANTTTKNFESMVRGSEMMRSGFFGRVLLTANETEKRFTRSDFPKEDLHALAKELAEILKAAPPLDSATGLPAYEKVIELTPDAFALWDDYYQNVERTEETERLDTYGQRLMAILAFTSGKSEIDLEVMKAVLGILDYEKALRETYWPSEAETPEALVQDKVLRALKRKYPQELSVREIEQSAKVREKYGADAIPEALKSLIKSKEVEIAPAAPAKSGQRQKGQKYVPRYKAVPEEV